MGKDVHGQIREKTRQDSSEHTGFVYHCDVAALLAASILLCVVAACVDCTPKSAPLVYNGRYIDLASCERKSAPLNEGEVRVTKIDTETGLPASASLAQVGVDGKDILRVNTATFNHQGRPVVLSFTDDVADRFCYLDKLLSGDAVWETNAEILKELLVDYSSPVSEVEP